MVGLVWWVCVGLFEFCELGVWVVWVGCVWVYWWGGCVYCFLLLWVLDVVIGFGCVAFFWVGWFGWFGWVLVVIVGVCCFNCFCAFVSLLPMFVFVG